jgi:hypothetical protein
MKTATVALISGMTLSLMLALHAVGAQSLVSTTDVSGAVTVTDLTARDGTVSGVLTNKSPRVVRDVKLLIRQTWLWNDERHPGDDAPGRSDFYTVPDPISPNGSVRFSYSGAPLPRRSDGRFQASVDVVGLTEIGD